ncbi:alpha/beta hydrolase [Chitinimonas sp.]|uniref:alpha/beta hydrolase n=1 Tax=Chitinimonas sp. TaxID=1934313 RepID=UPI0035B4F8CD
MQTSSLLLALALLAPTTLAQAGESITLFDADRQRSIPVELFFPDKPQQCSVKSPCPTVLLSAGYGGQTGDYRFVCALFNRRGYLVASVQHQQPDDPPYATSGDLFTLRMPNWQRGAQNLRYVQHSLNQRYPAYDWRQPILLGHSNGGDISALLLRESPRFASALITLDNRRVPLPRDARLPLLSIRASDTEADPGVLPTPQEQATLGQRIVRLQEGRHNDMQDGGSEALKQDIARLIGEFLDRLPPHG